MVLAGAVLHAPSLGWGFLYDDYIHQFVIRVAGTYRPVNPLNLYDFASDSTRDELREHGLIPWWTSDDLRVRYFRPVTSLSILVDSAVYGDWAPGYHATSILLFAAFLFLAFRLYLALGAPVGAARWGLTFLALDDVHALPVGWIAARATLMGALFVTVTLLAVDRYERGKKPLDLGLAVLCFLAACGSKEDSAILVPVVALYLLLVKRPSDSESLVDGCLRVLRSRTLWALALTAGVYVALYVKGRYGTNSALHVTPWGEPGQFAIRFLTTMIPLGFTSLFFGVPGGDLIFTRPDLKAIVVGFGFAAVALLVVILWRWARPRSLAFLAVSWSLLAFAPASVVETSDRLLTIASIGSALALGLVMDNLGSLRMLVASRAYRAAAVWILFLATGVLLSMPMLHLRGRLFAALGARDREAILSAEIEPAEGKPLDVLQVTSPSTLLGIVTSLTTAVHRNDPAIRVYALQLARRPTTWQRESEESLVVTYGSRPLLGHPFELFFRTTRIPPPPGTTFETSAFVATVLEVDDAGIRTVRFSSARSFDDSSFCLLAWKEGRFRRIRPPAVGETAILEEPEPTVPYAP